MDVAALGYAIDSTQAVTAATNLDRMTDAAGRADGAQSGLQRTSGRTNTSLVSVVAAIKGVTAAQNAGNAIAQKQIDMFQQLLTQTQGLATAANSAQGPIVGVTAALRDTEQQAQKTWRAYQAVNVMFDGPAGAATGMQAQIDGLTGVARASDEAGRSAVAYGADLDALRARFNPLFAASRRYEEELRDIAAAERMGAISAMEAARARENATRIIRTMDTATVAATGGIARYGQQMTNASFQVQDFFVQIASGQAITTAFAQQAPQLLGSFGFVGKLALFGSLAGTAVAVGSAVIPMLFNMGDEAKSAGDRIDDLNGAMERYRDAADAAGQSTADLREQYGDLAVQVRLALVAQMDAAAYDARKALSDAMDDVGSDFTDALANLGRSGDRVSFQAARNAARTLADDYRLSADEAMRLKSSFDALDAAEGPADVARAASDLRSELLATYGTMQNMPAAVAEIYRQLNDVVVTGADMAKTMGDIEDAGWNIKDALFGLPDYFTSADGAAQGFLGTMREAANEAWRLANARVAAEGLLDDAGNPTNMLAGDRGRNRPQSRPFELTDRNAEAGIAALPRTSRGGGGRNVIDMEAERQRRAAEGYFTRTRTPQEEYASTVAELEALKSGGLLDGDTFTRAMQDAREQMDGVAKDTLGVGSAFSNLLSGMMDGAQTAGDAMEGFVASVLNNVLAKMTQPSVDVLGNAASQFLSGFLPKGTVPSFDGGGWTGSGSRSGGVDGKGGFWAINHPREYIHDTTKGAMLQMGGQQNVHVTVGVDKNGNLTPFVQQTAGRMDAQSARIQQKTMPGHIANMQGRGLA